ncbi:GGDEF domain-containing protein [Amorphus sp. 3PC139-8]|uniref:GGDEF domain-containing protein n=1 Tax=Amorphus sp. 3PC139-8 TaxID=2735676 RepID=UPI00345DD522
MSFDVNTLYSASVLVLGLVGVLLLWAWLQSRHSNALVWWAFAFIVSTIGVVLLSDWDILPDLWSVEVALTLIVVGHGLIWAGVRSFAGKPVPWFGILIGAIVWMIAYQTQAVEESTTDRVVIMALLSIIYSALTAFELIRQGGFAMRSGRAAVGLLVLHIVMLLLRIPVARQLPFPFQDETADPHMALLTIEPMLFAVAIGFVLLTLTRERDEAIEHAAASTDPLTGVLNRRGFFDAAEKLRRRAGRHKHPVAALLLDIDHFKVVNDTYGHAAGDAVLERFAAGVRETLRLHDVFGRIGGEEFAIVFAEGDQEQVGALAERIRKRIEAQPIDWRNTEIAITTSVGVAVDPRPTLTVEALLEAADRALYEAKRRGRNQVVVANTAARTIDKPAGGPVPDDQIDLRDTSGTSLS